MNGIKLYGYDGTEISTITLDSGPISEDIYENILVKNELAKREKEIKSLKEELELYKRELPAIKKAIAKLESKEKVIMIREITKQEARKEIQKIYATGRTLYFSDIADELKLDLELVVGICMDMLKKGEIVIANSR